VASYIFQSPKGYRSLEKVQSLIDECVPSQPLRGLLDTMVNEGELLSDHGRIKLGRYWLDRMGSGLIHSNIEDKGGYQVVDATTGQKIASGVRYSQGKGLKTGGNKLQVQGIESNRLLVTKQKKAKEEASWGYVGYNSPDSSNQAQALRYYLDIPDEVWPIIQAKSETYVFHFGGRRTKILIDMLAKKAVWQTNPQIAESNGIYLRFPGLINEKPDWLTNQSAAALHQDILENLSSLENKLSRPAANKKLPLKARIDEVKGWLGVEREVERLNKSVWKYIADEQHSLLNTLVNTER
jgi:hypothetical protein